MGSFRHESSDLQHPERRGTKPCSLGFFFFLKNQNLVPAEICRNGRSTPKLADPRLNGWYYRTGLHAGTRYSGRSGWNGMKLITSISSLHLTFQVQPLFLSFFLFYLQVFSSTHQEEMAEASTLGVAQDIIGRLSSTTFEEIGSIWGFSDDFGKLKDTISTILDAEQQNMIHQNEDWIMKFKGAVYVADDLLTDFFTEHSRGRVIGGQTKIAKTVRTFFSSSNQPAFFFKMGHKIKTLRKRLDEIAEESKHFRTVERPLQQTVVTENRDRSHPFIHEEVLGREEDMENIIDLLLNLEKTVSFIPIVGDGGVGKTTLAQCVYNDEKVKAYFELQMWVRVSDVFDVRTIVEKIIQSATGWIPENLSIDEQHKIRKVLEQKKYLLVLDGMLNEDADKWSNLKSFLMGGAKGSKVLITTRSKLVATITSTVSPYFLDGLSQDQSWSLLKQMAFEGEDIDSNFEAIGMEIVQKCRRVPFAIKIIGRMLYFKRTVDEWLDFKDKELTFEILGETGVLSILKLSYNHLPLHLRCCFGYCSAFPKDYEIRMLTLIQLWIARGFIQSLDDKQLEVAHEYCMDLLWRSFFLKTKEDYLGNVICLKMHDLFHDLAQSLSTTECSVFDFNAQNVNENVGGHLSFPNYRAFEENISSFIELKKTRTFILTSDPRYLDQKVEEESSFRQLASADQKVKKESSLKRLFSSFGSLRALDLHDLRIVMVPNSINKLKYLKYLDLSENDIEVLPGSIIRLLTLETLKLSRCIKLKDLPKDIYKMVNLKHLEIDGCKSLAHMPFGLGQLTLHTLPLFVVSKDPVVSSSKHCGGLAELKMLDKLRGELHIKNLAWLKNATAEIRDANLGAKQHLIVLKLSWDSEGIDDTHVHDDENSLEGLQPHHGLKTLQVIGYQGKRLSTWLPKLTSLVKLEIRQCVWQHLSPLYELPFLQELYLVNMIGLEYISDREITDEISTSLASSFFPALKSLKLWDCPNLKGWWKSDIVEVSIDNDQGDLATGASTSSQHISLPSFHSLSYLYIMNCMRLTCMPLFPNLEEELILSNANLKPLQQTMEMTMNMTTASSLSSSSSPPLSNLKSLSLFYMQDIESLSEDWLQKLTSLECLHIWMCPRLKFLSRSMQLLTSLKKLEIGDCEEVDLINDKSDNGTKWLTSLQELRLTNFPCLLTLPEWIGNLKLLQILKIDNFPKLISLPEWIGNLKSLQKLEIYLCPELTSLSEGMHKLVSLQCLEIIDCPHLKERCLSKAWLARVPNFRND